MRGSLGIRTALCALTLGVTLPAYRSPGASSASAIRTPASVVVGFLSALALGATPADVLPLAYVGAVAKARALPLQVAEAAAPAFRDAAGPGAAATALLAQTLRGQNGLSPDPRAQAQSRISAVLGSVAQTLDLAAPSSPVANDPLGFARSVVDPASGILHLTYQDLSIPARGQPLALARTFVSGNPAPSALGNGWAFTYGTHLAYDANGNPMIEEATGVTTHFALWEAPSTYIAVDAPAREILTLEPSGGATRLMIDGGSQQFDSLGRLTRLQDRAGIGITVNYAGSQLRSVVDSDGRSLRFTVTRAGLISAVTDPTGAMIRYGHDGAGDLTSVTTAAGATTHYSYSTPLANSYDTVRLTRITLPRGGAIRFSYNVGAQVTGVAGPGAMWTSIRYTGGADPGTMRTDLTDATGAHTEIDTFNTTPISGEAQLPTVTHIVDPSGRSSMARVGPSGTMVADGEGRLTQVADDANGRPIVVQSPRTGATRLGYDDLTSELSSLTDATGHAVTLLYDAKGNLSGIRDAVGAVTRLQPTGPGAFRVIKPGGRSAALRFDGAGNLIDVVDAMGRRTQLSWDRDGRLIGIDDPVHGHTSYQYGPSGALLTRVDAGGAATRYAYDADGNLTAMRDPLGRFWRFVYNTGDLPTALTDPLGETWRLRYDADGRVTALTDPLGKATKLSYDAAGRLLSVTDPLGHATRYRYGAAGELVSAASPAGRTTQYRYDAAGRPAVVQHPVG
ncbi:MAG TPA: DUF6531 domain-containing protein, partial [Chloroflexota bacterium]|nr:DUF6531 domain-containing protein [Chloroflexota bacterium]